MSVAELKEEAIRQFALKVEALDDEQALNTVIEFLNKIESGDKNAVNLSRHYDSIKFKFGTVLEKLAK